MAINDKSLTFDLSDNLYVNSNQEALDIFEMFSYVFCNGDIEKSKFKKLMVMILVLYRIVQYQQAVLQISWVSIILKQALIIFNKTTPSCLFIIQRLSITKNIMFL